MDLTRKIKAAILRKGTIRRTLNGGDITEATSAISTSYNGKRLYLTFCAEAKVVMPRSGQSYSVSDITQSFTVLVHPTASRGGGTNYSLDQFAERFPDFDLGAFEETRTTMMRQVAWTSDDVADATKRRHKAIRHFTHEFCLYEFCL